MHQSGRSQDGVRRASSEGGERTSGTAGVRGRTSMMIVRNSIITSTSSMARRSQYIQDDQGWNKDGCRSVRKGRNASSSDATCSLSLSCHRAESANDMYIPIRTLMHASPKACTACLSARLHITRPDTIETIIRQGPIRLGSWEGAPCRIRKFGRQERREGAQARLHPNTYEYEQTLPCIATVTIHVREDATSDRAPSCPSQPARLPHRAVRAPFGVHTYAARAQGGRR